MRGIVLLIALLLSSAAFADPSKTGAAYWRDNWRGWHFYEEPEDEPESRPPVRPPATRPNTPPAPPPEIAAFEQLQKSLEDQRKIAIMRPTEANVRRYMEIEAQVVAQASTFADIAQRVVWANPALDPSLVGRPVNAQALEVFEAQQAAERTRAVSALTRDHVLIFFFRGDCPYCHAFAPTLDAFRTRHGLKVLAVSLDGGALPGFADARRDNGIATTLKVMQVPALYLARPAAGVVTPIGQGVLSSAQLLERLSAAASPQASQRPTELLAGPTPSPSP
jgi:conjugal transfer pilus assembly protein TraF